MKGESMSADGHSINYELLKNSQTFQECVNRSRELKGVDVNGLDPDQKKAFFINVYNACTIHGLADLDTLPNSVLEVEQFWKKTAYVIGEQVYTLDDMEHGVLRGNRPHPSSDKPFFGTEDPRLSVALETVDPRIHFALVCGAKSCPPINVYSEKNLDYALNAAAGNYLDSEITVDVNKREIMLPKLLQWYGCDFGETPEEVARWTLPYVSDDKAQEMKTLLESNDQTDKLQIKYSTYDWQLNKATKH
ncbi:uncharacterized protein [Amphiura filiformis]